MGIVLINNILPSIEHFRVGGYWVAFFAALLETTKGSIQYYDTEVLRTAHDKGVVVMLSRRLKTITIHWVILIFSTMWSMSACKQQDEEPYMVAPEVAFTESLSEHSLLEHLSTAITEVAKKALPAVVHVEVTERKNVALPPLPFEDDPSFRYSFDAPQMPLKFKSELRGIGTGIIIDINGHVLTNTHVVAGATAIEVLLANGKWYPATLIGTDSKTDLAVIKISANQPFPHIIFGDSDKVKMGDWVIAIGHLRGLDQTVTQGIISAKHRTGASEGSSYQDYLQTDAAINPGNYGGPLLDLRRKVIGINAAIVGQAGGFERVGFAIPSKMAQHIAKQLIAHGAGKR